MPLRKENTTWILPENRDICYHNKFHLDGDKFTRTVSLAFTGFSLNRPEMGTVFMMPLNRIIHHEQKDQDRVFSPVSIHHRWQGPPLIGGVAKINWNTVFYAEKVVKRLGPEHDGDQFFLLDGENRLDTSLLVEAYLNDHGIEHDEILVPFQVCNYPQIFIGSVPDPGLHLTHEQVIYAARTGNLVPPKATVHGFRVDPPLTLPNGIILANQQVQNRARHFEGPTNSPETGIRIMHGQPTVSADFDAIFGVKRPENLPELDELRRMFDH